MSKTDKADIIKDHAINGRFIEIEVAYGAKAAIKGREYASLKLVALKSKIDAGENIDEQRTATEFMKYAIKSNESQDMEALGRSFVEGTSAKVMLNAVREEGPEDEISTQLQTQNEEVTGEISHSADRTEIDAEGLSTPTIVVRKSGFQMPELQSTKPTVKVTVVTDEKIIPRKKACDTQDLSRKSLTHKSIGKSPAVSKRSMKLPKAQKISKADFPNAPRKAMNAYMYFAESNRKDVISEDPSMKVTEIMKELGLRWRLLGDDEKFLYEERSRVEKCSYIAQMKDYHNLFPTEADQYDIYQKKGQASAADKSKSSSSGKTGIKDTRLKAASDIDSDDNNSSENEQADVSESEEEEGDRAIHHKEHKKSSHVQNLKSIKKKPLCSSFGMSKQSKNSLISPQKRKLSAHKNSQLKRLKSKTGYRRIDVSQTSPSKPTAKYIDPVAAATETARIISAFKGIKESDLPISEDIKRTKTLPKLKCPFPADFEPGVGDKVTLVTKSYRDFVSTLAADLLSSADLKMIQEACLIPESIVHAIIENFKVVEVNNDGVSKEETGTVRILSLKIRGAIHAVLYVPYSSPLLKTEIFLLDRMTYTRSIKATWLIVNAQVRRLFAAESGLSAEWHEGSIYHVRSDMKEDPYSSVSVVWLDQESNPRQWFYAYHQLDNLCSPWDLQLSAFVLPENVRPVSLPRALTLGSVTAEAVLSYLQSFDFSSVFMYNLEANSEYREMFPNKQDRLDLHVIGSRCEEGCYEGPSKLLILFDDLYRMCSNGKKFNSSNEGFQPWTLADMMEKTVSTLQDTLSHGKYSASNLTNGTSSSRIEMRSHNSMPLNENGSKYGDLKDPYEDDEETGVRRSLELEEV